MKDKCFVCQSPMFSGWVENPMYRDNGSDTDEEIMVEMNISYCPTCNKLSHSGVKVSVVDVEHDTFQLINKWGGEND